ncbi:MAG: carboxypeptidase-like regulatory domain-containing protein, partial [Vicinamibacterales bacterium]
MSRLVVLVGIGLALAAVSAAGQTQITTGVIQGTVSDPSGALVPGATVEVRNVDTNLARTLTTAEDGRFVVLQLPPGRYRVTVSLQGFATHVQEDVT